MNKNINFHSTAKANGSSQGKMDCQPPETRVAISVSIGISKWETSGCNCSENDAGTLNRKRPSIEEVRNNRKKYRQLQLFE